MTLISIVVPVFNEASSVAQNLKSILVAAATPGHDFELIVVNDGSTDETLHVLDRLAEEDARIKPLHFTRNFGKESAIFAGLSFVRGAAAVTIDADLQHPPQLIPRMIQLWSQGIPVVSAVKSLRGPESPFSRLHAAAFYQLFRILAGIDMAGQSDFKLLDRVVVDTLLEFPEKKKFFRGLVDWCGYEHAQIPFDVAEREGGSSRWGFVRLARYAINNITSFSSAPLKIISVLGLLTLIVGVVFGSISVFQKINGVAVDGFTTVNLLIIFSSGAIMMSLGVIGHYLAKIHDEIKARPVYLIKPTHKAPNETTIADRRVDTV